MTDKAMGAYSDPNSMPPLGQAVPLGLQHVLAMFASNVTPSIIVAGAAGLAFGSAEQIYLIQMAMLFAGVATIFQTMGFGPVGARMPIMQGTSFAFVGVLAGISATQGLGVALTACIIGGLIHFALGSVIGRIRFLFPPLVTGLVILAIGLYLIPVGIKYAAGGAADFQMAAESFGSLKHWTVALTVIVVALLFKFKTSGAALNSAWVQLLRSRWCQSCLPLKPLAMHQQRQRQAQDATQPTKKSRAQHMQTVWEPRSRVSLAVCQTHPLARTLVLLA